MNDTKKLLEVRDLHKAYSKEGVPTKALNGITFDVLNGEYLGIMGASGSGKTTLLNCIATVIKPTSGQILLSGANISSFDGTKLAEYRGNKIGYLFQDFALLDNLTGKENIILPLSIHNIDIVTAEKKLKDIADFLGITDVLSKFPSQMSGGQKQRVAAARSLISDPDIILADEPTGALDTKSARLLMEKLQEINLRRGRTILMVTHDPNAASFCSRILFIQDGVIFHELRRKIPNETQEDFYARILQVMAQMGEEVQMFFNLTWRNAKRSRSENLIYFLTMITAVAMFYIVLSLGQQDVIRFLSEIESDAVERLLTNLLPTVYLCALLFVFFLVVFANKYQLECRSRELGLYLMFGMTKIKLFIQIMTEGLITSFLALLGGLVCGGFLSEAISLTTARLVGHGIITHQLSFSVSAAIFTSLGFLIIQFVALFVLCGKLFRKELHQLVYGEMAKKQRTGNPYVSFVSFAIGTVILLVAYWIVVEHFMAASGAMLLIAVLLGIIGTILFIRGLARILSIWAASIKHKATRGLYVFTLRQLHENVVNKYISISVASILMMLTIMLITDGSVRIMSYGSELTRGTSVYDFTVMGNDQIVEKYLSNEQIRPYVSNLNRMEIGNIKSTASDGISSPVDWSKFRKQIVQHLPQDVVDPATQEDGMYSFGSDQPAALNLLGLIDTGSFSPYLLPVSSYNRLLDAAGEKQISLGNNEVVYYLNPDFLGNAQDETVTLLNQIAADAQANNEALLSINERPFYLVPSVPMKGLTADENIKIITALIVSDEIYSEFVNSDTCMVYWNFCIPNELVETKGLMLPIMEARDLLKPSGLYYESYLNNFGRQLFYVISGSYTTLYMGFMFLIIACALLALQFLTQMQTTKSRYLTLSILGARREQIKRSINQQVLWYFLLPLILACISGAVGIYAMQLYLYSGAAHLEQSYPLLIAMAVIVVLVMVIYGVAVARTANREIGKLNYKPNS